MRDKHQNVVKIGPKSVGNSFYSLLDQNYTKLRLKYVSFVRKLGFRTEQFRHKCHFRISFFNAIIILTGVL